MSLTKIWLIIEHYEVIWSCSWSYLIEKYLVVVVRCRGCTSIFFNLFLWMCKK